jgi:hypothetical protein
MPHRDNTESDLFDKGYNRDGAKPLHDRLLKIASDFREAYDEKKRRRDAQGQKVLYAGMGKTMVDENEIGLLEEIEIEEGEIYITVPIYSAMLRSIAKEATKSNPLFGFRPLTTDVDESQVARYGATLAEHYGSRFWTHRFEQGDVQNALAFGFTLWDLHWDPNRALDREGAGDSGATTCPDCDVTVKGRRCPDCGKGVKRKKAAKGDLTFRAWHPFLVNFDAYHDEVSEMGWLSIDEIVDESAWRKIGVEQRATEASILNDSYLHLRRLRSFQRASAGLETTVNLSRAASELLGNRESIVSHDFIAPENYEDYEVPADCELVDEDGSKIKVPAGKRLIDYAPDGVELLHCHLKRVYQVRVCDWRQRFLICNHSIKDGDLSGTSPAPAGLECQYNIDELISQALTAAYEMGSPTWFYDEGAIEDGMGAGGSGSAKIPMRRHAPEVGLEQLVKIVPPAGVSDQIFVLIQMLKQDMQGILGAPSLMGGGLPDTIGKTATAATLQQAQGESQQAMYLSLRSEMKAEVVCRLWPIFHDNATEERAMRMAGPDGGGALLMMRGEMLPRRVEVYVKENSFWPRELFQRQNQLAQYYQMKMLAGQANMASGERTSLAERRSIANLFQCEVALQQAETAAEIANERIKAAREFLELAATDKLDADQKSLVLSAQAELEEMAMQAAAELATIDPENAPPPPLPSPEDAWLKVCAEVVVPIDEGLDPHADMAEFYREWAREWRGRHSPRVLRKFLSETAKRHDELANQSSMDLMSALGGPPTGAGAAPGGGQAGATAPEMLLTEMSAMAGSGQSPSGAPPAGGLRPPSSGSRPSL